MRRYLLFFLFIHATLSASDWVHFPDSHNNKNITFFLSTPKSGTNVITGSLSALTRKPISWFYWGRTISNSSSPNRNHLSYNRLELPLVSHVPLLYRTHYEFAQLKQVPSELNKLIFATRNPKELIYRSFFLQASRVEEPSDEFVKEFLEKYLKAFEIYDSWHQSNRKIIFYEDFIVNDNEILLELLLFMKETPVFLEDFLNNKQEYLSKILQSYSHQHQHNFGGSSSKNGPKPIYYTKDASLERLTFIDNYLKHNAPKIWESYLKRFETLE